MRNTLIGLVLIIVLGVGLAALSSYIHPGSSSSSDTSTQTTPPAPKKPPVSMAQAQAAFTRYQQGAVSAKLTVKNRGVILLQLYPKAAPKTVARIVQLCKQGFYNGILFHRVVPGFVVQAGDPSSKHVKGSAIASLTADQVMQQYQLGSSGSGQTIPFEKNSLDNIPGTIAMALSMPQSDTGDSQFFINLGNNASLNGDYCVFGRVVKGMKVVDAIRQGDRIVSFTTGS